MSTDVAVGYARAQHLAGAAAKEAAHAAQWLENGGPLAYDLGEAHHHLATAEKLIERARRALGDSPA